MPRRKKQDADKTVESLLLDSIVKMSETTDAEAILADPLRAKQREVTSKMRTSLISCSETSDLSVARNSLNNITALRIYHQVSRIIRYTEMMDKLEEKLYESVEYQINNADVSDMSNMFVLLKMQQSLQQSMIESQKLLQPYLDIADMIPPVEVGTEESSVHVLPKISRDKLRVAAQSVLADIQKNGEAQ